MNNKPVCRSRLHGASIPKPEEVFGDSSEHLADSSEHLSGRRDERGFLISERLDAPILDSLDHLSPACRAALEEIAALPRSRKKVNKEAMEAVIVRLCTGHYLTASCIAALVERDPDALRQQYLRPLVQAGQLRFAFPTAPTHLMQAYRTNELES